MKLKVVISILFLKSVAFAKADYSRNKAVITSEDGMVRTFNHESDVIIQELPDGRVELTKMDLGHAPWQALDQRLNKLGGG